MDYPVKISHCLMEINEELRRYSSQPLTHQLLLSLLKGYKKPNSRIHALLKEGILQSIKKGLYIAGPALNLNRRPEPFLIANHLIGPSYVSCETALSFHGLIPERVYEIASMTTKSPRKFNTVMGIFTYAKLPLPYYSFGIQQIKLTEEQTAMVASPEKALCDKIITTSGIVLRSRKSVTSYLLENMRMDEERLKKLDTSQMATWVPDAMKKESLTMVINTLQDL